MPVPSQPEVVVRRSARRRKTVSAHWSEDTVVLSVPQAATRREIEHWTRELVPRVVERRRRETAKGADRRSDDRSQAASGLLVHPRLVLTVAHAVLFRAGYMSADLEIELVAVLLAPEQLPTRLKRLEASPGRLQQRSPPLHHRVSPLERPKCTLLQTYGDGLRAVRPRPVVPLGIADADPNAFRRQRSAGLGRVIGDEQLLRALEDERDVTAP